jgi:Flp pilus assembly pilin Flp
MMQAVARLRSLWLLPRSGSALSRLGRSRAHRWLVDERGQDLVEYALLTAAIGFTSLLAVNFLGGAMRDTYVSWDSAGQTPDLVEVPDPAPAP